MIEKIWAHSGDSHFLEPADLWHQIMPKARADRMPRTEMISDHEERVTVDGKSFVRSIPKIMRARGATGETIAEMSHRPPGARDVRQRLVDLAHQRKAQRVELFRAVQRDKRAPVEALGKNELIGHVPHSSGRSRAFFRQYQPSLRCSPRRKAAPLINPISAWAAGCRGGRDRCRRGPKQRIMHWQIEQAA